MRFCLDLRVCCYMYGIVCHADAASFKFLLVFVSCCAQREMGSARHWVETITRKQLEFPNESDDSAQDNDDLPRETRFPQSLQNT